MCWLEDILIIIFAKYQIVKLPFFYYRSVLEIEIFSDTCPQLFSIST